jgi:hypothetical protein
MRSHADGGDDAPATAAAITVIVFVVHGGEGGVLLGSWTVIEFKARPAATS